MLQNADVIHLYFGGKNRARLDGGNGRMANKIAPHGQIHKKKKWGVERSGIRTDGAGPTGLCFIHMTVNGEADGIGFPIDPVGVEIGN